MSLLRQRRIAFCLALILLVSAGCSLHLCGTVCGPCHDAGCAPHAWEGIYPTVVTPYCSGVKKGSGTFCRERPEGCCAQNVPDPFFTPGGIDTVSLAQQVRYQLDGHVHGLLVLGTVGEGMYANMQERADVISTAVRVAGGRAKVVVGIHTCDVKAARAQLLQAKKLGADAVLVKYVGNPHATGAEVLAFFAALSEMNALPIFYYHYPSDTGLCLTADEIAAILALPNVIGIKESILDLGEAEAHMQLTRGMGKVYLSGTALNLTQFLKLGGHGAMCPEAALMPGTTSAAFECYRAGRCREARALQKKVYVLLPVLSSRAAPPFLVRPLLMAAFDAKVSIPMTPNQMAGRIKLTLDYLGVPTPICMKNCACPPTFWQSARAKCTARKIERMERNNCVCAPVHNQCEAQVPSGPSFRRGCLQLP